MICVFILNRITGKNYGFLKLGYFSYFQRVEIFINCVPCLSHPNNYIPQSHQPYESRFLVETSIIYSVGFLHLL